RLALLLRLLAAVLGGLGLGFRVRSWGRGAHLQLLRQAFERQPVREAGETGRHGGLHLRDRRRVRAGIDDVAGGAEPPPALVGLVLGRRAGGLPLRLELLHRRERRLVVVGGGERFGLLAEEDFLRQVLLALDVGLLERGLA